MTDTDLDGTSGKPRFRSPPYPAIDLAKAVERAKQLYGKALLNPVGVPVLADAWGYREKSSGLWATAAALIHYGLIQDEGTGAKRKFMLTDSARRIVRDADPESQKRKGAIQRAALAPSIHKELWEKIGSGNGLSDTWLKNYLTLDRADEGKAPFGDQAAEDLIRIYRDTIAYAGIQESDTVTADTEDMDNGLGNDLTAPDDEQVRRSPDTKKAPPSANPKGAVLLEGERIVFTEEGEPNQYLKVLASGEVDGVLLEALEDFVKRQRKRLGQDPAKAPADKSH